MGFSLDEIEAAALSLPEASRAELMERLMLSFQKSSDWNDQIARTWTEEAVLRDQEMTETGDEGIPAEEVFRQLRSRHA